MASFSLRGVLSAAALLSCGVGASAHVTLERSTVVPDTTYRGVLQVNHGCRGAATTAISVTIPEGVIGVRPVPKPGWKLTIDRAAYKKPYKLYGETLTEGPRALTWSGGTLPDDEYDEFTFVARVTGDYVSGATLYFPVVQSCGATVSRWVEEPAPGQEPARLSSPAPAVHVIAAASGAAPAAAMSDHDMRMPMGGEDKAAPAAMSGHTVKAGAIVIATPWMRATPGGAQVAGAYIRLTNTGSEPDRLIGASIALAKRGEVHEMSIEGGVMKMHEVEGGLEIKPGQTVELKPGGYHLMFLDLIAAPKQGEEIKGTLTFAKAGTVTVVFPVAAIGASAPPAK